MSSSREVERRDTERFLVLSENRQAMTDTLSQDRSEFHVVDRDAAKPRGGDFAIARPGLNGG
jgi:hypothetical protein